MTFGPCPMHRKVGASTLMCLWWSSAVPPRSPVCVHVASTLTSIFIHYSECFVKKFLAIFLLCVINRILLLSSTTRYLLSRSSICIQYLYYHLGIFVNLFCDETAFIRRNNFLVFASSGHQPFFVLNCCLRSLILANSLPSSFSRYDKSSWLRFAI